LDSLRGAEFSTLFIHRKTRPRFHENAPGGAPR